MEGANIWILATGGNEKIIELIFSAEIACMNSHPVREWCAPPLLDFDHWHCLHEIPSRPWVVCASSARFRLLTLPAWNPIQRVSGVCLLCSILITDIACIKSHPGCEWCAPPLLDFDHWHCLHEIPSSMWVVCASSARFWSLTLPAWNPIQSVSGVRLLCSIAISDIACIKSHPGSEWCAPPLLDFDLWHINLSILQFVAILLCSLLLTPLIYCGSQTNGVYNVVNAQFNVRLSHPPHVSPLIDSISRRRHLCVLL